MNSDQLEGKWKQMKGSVKEKWGKLTDDDLDVIAGKQDQLAGKIRSVTEFRRKRPRSRYVNGRTPFRMRIGPSAGAQASSARAARNSRSRLCSGGSNTNLSPVYSSLTLRSYRSYLENRQPAPAGTDTKLRRIIWLIADRAIPHHYCACRLF